MTFITIGDHQVRLDYLITFLFVELTAILYQDGANPYESAYNIVSIQQDLQKICRGELSSLPMTFISRLIDRLDAEVEVTQ